MDVVITSVVFTLMACGLLLAGNQWYVWRSRAVKLQAFIENPNVQQVDKEAEYKDSYEAKLNALEDERNEQHNTMIDVFDFLNDNSPFGSHQEGLLQCRNKLMETIQNSTFGRT